jgi:catechol 2,3-dioxygenase-like lactoylglutathione lyase family enzyme
MGQADEHQPMKHEGASQLSGRQGSNGLGERLQGVQHVGVTVDDWTKSLEFYVEVLGGRIAAKGTGFYGDVLYNTLFEKEGIDAVQTNTSTRSLGVADVRDGTKEMLDVCFISFGNVCIELLHFRDARLDPTAPNTFPKLPTSVGYGNAGHISFHVKDDVDLNVFARDLEEECRRRDIKNVICNRVVTVRSHEERLGLPLKYAANKFWNEPEYFIEGYSDMDFGDFHGWSLFYAKGPNGEQLEFNQVTRTIKTSFDAARDKYNEDNNTDFAAPRPRNAAVKK